MGSYTSSEFEYNKYIDFTLKLEKICYFPGENINGLINLKGKPGIENPKLTDPGAVFIISEKQKNYLSNDINESNIFYIKNEIDNNIYTQNLVFNNFRNADLLSGLNIPFSIQIPPTAHPTCSIYRRRNNIAYIIHCLSVTFQSLSLRRMMLIVIKNNPNYIFISPLTLSEKRSKSSLAVKKGDFSINISLPKNVFYYDELVPYEIVLDCTNLNIKVSRLEISLIRNKKINDKNDCHKSIDIIKDNIWTEYKELDTKEKRQIIKGSFQFPQFFGKEKYVYPPSVYEDIEKNEEDFPKLAMFNDLAPFYEKYSLTPSCLYGLMSVEYNFRVKIMFESPLTVDEKFIMTLDFCSRPNEPILNDIYGNNNDVNSFGINNDNMNANYQINPNEQYSKPLNNMKNNEIKKEEKVENSNFKDFNQFNNEIGSAAPLPSFNINNK